MSQLLKRYKAFYPKVRVQQKEKVDYIYFQGGDFIREGLIAGAGFLASGI